MAVPKSRRLRVAPVLDSIIVCGGRDGQEPEELEFAMNRIRGLIRYDHIITGTFNLPGERHISTDHQVFLWAIKNEIPVTIVSAKWKTGQAGRGEGPNRNHVMATMFGKPNATFAFPGGTGTASMSAISRSLKIKLFEWVPSTWKWERAA